jgi:hypothetical protein
VEPIVERLDIPAEYGNPTELLSWSDVRADLEAARVYWLASARSDGRPHVVPRDGMWIDDALYYGGAASTVHARNVASNPNVVAHVGGGQDAIIVEGIVEIERPDEAGAARLADASYAKYPEYGRMDSSVYAGGVQVLRPRRVLAWKTLFVDATRFRFA